MDYYAMRHKVTGKVYIGCSHGACGRIGQHIQLLRSGEHSNVALQDDCNKFGILFDFFLLEQRDERDRNVREKEWQAMYRTTDPKYGYNTSLAEKIRPLDAYPKIEEVESGYEIERRRCDALYDSIRCACAKAGKDIDEVRKACRVGKVEIHNLIDVDGYYNSSAFLRLTKEIGVNGWDLSDDVKETHVQRLTEEIREKMFAPYTFEYGMKIKQSTVRNEAIAKGYRNIDIEEILGVSKAMASRWLRGERNLRKEKLIALKRYMAITEKEVANENHGS